MGYSEEGVKYRFAYFDPDEDENILRYDNAHKHAGSKHYKHIRGETYPVEYEGYIRDHFRKFRKEVQERYDRG